VPPTSRQTILVVEDDIPLRDLYRTALVTAGFDVRVVGNGYDALQSLDDHRPHLVVLDLGLPVVSGHVVRQELAAQAHTRDIPVVIVTGETSAVDKDKRDGDCVLAKPVTPDRLVAVVRSCLASGAPMIGS
jgi:DNA-binding response OmpR family regulator